MSVAARYSILRVHYTSNVSVEFVGGGGQRRGARPWAPRPPNTHIVHSLVVVKSEAG